MEVSIDVADAIQSELNALGHSASAAPLPEDFEGRLPFTRVESLGGRRSRIVLDTFNVHLDTWAETPAAALAEANLVAAALTEMVGGMAGTVPVYAVALASLPHEAEDPHHPSLPMASFMAQVTVRTTHV